MNWTSVNLCGKMTWEFVFQLQKSKEREERLEEVIQAYEKIHLEKSNVQRDLDKMVRFLFIPAMIVSSIVSFYFTMSSCLSDNSGRAAYGADLQSGVGSEAEGDVPPETERSTPQQRCTPIPSPCQPGCTQRWVLFGSKTSWKINNMAIIINLQVAGSRQRQKDMPAVDAFITFPLERNRSFDLAV